MPQLEKVIAKAPSNIALIKYMGKKDASRNLPLNPSLSLTLNGFATVAELTALQYDAPGTAGMRWLPETPQHAQPETNFPWFPSKWSAESSARIDRFIGRLFQELPPILKQFNLPFRSLTGFELRTANTFPPGTGLASSASAFAAITLAFAGALCSELEQFQQDLEEKPELRKALAKISRLGSGSSCRSWLGPWVQWDNEEVTTVSANVAEYSDLVMLIKAAPKAVSSSEAHKRVLTSSAWPERSQHAAERCKQMVSALQEGNTAEIARLTWQDCWEMHQLFHTAEPPFTYWEPETFSVLKWLMSDPPSTLARPIVTLDAGPNLHLLVPKDVAPNWRSHILESFPTMTILEDTQGRGAELLQ